MKALKKFGRFFLVLTEEDKRINPEDIKCILIIHMGETYLNKTFEAIQTRFPSADIKTVSSDTMIGIIAKLYRLKAEQISMIIVLALNPFVLFFLILIFDCYFLIYNRFDQFFLIRRKTLYEFLAGRKGADRKELDWEISPARLNFAKCTAVIFISPVVFIKNTFRFLKLIMYIFVRLLYIGMKRYYYKFIAWRKI